MQDMQTKPKNTTSPATNKAGRPAQNPVGLLKQLELYRLENRVTQEKLAKEIGVNFSTVSRWLNGKTKPNKIQQYHIEKFLKGKTKHGKR
jgi:DNA-binding XRE family transcriptional regulator